LLGAYYDNIDFTGFTLSRIDPLIAFDWGEGSRSAINPDTFSVDGRRSQPQFSKRPYLYCDKRRWHPGLGETSCLSTPFSIRRQPRQAARSTPCNHRIPIRIGYFEDHLGQLRSCFGTTPRRLSKSLPTSQHARVFDAAVSVSIGLNFGANEPPGGPNGARSQRI
jgi:hypothetical protein